MSQVVIIKKLGLLLWLLLWFLLMIIVIIDGEYWWLLLMMIIDDCDKTNFSDKINEVIRSVLNFYFFSTIRFHKYKKAPKNIKKH